ncbi:disease resistance protein isoform X1 [Gossypium australe]|uniref:Disease resistance protein isoform X1 n=1 Tax=Gossypium australe TaxID=47621 RepID=A0A5B6U955_9ROSI|nr:disease resistance protein isoform X1 [Gossypium australe]
MGCGICGAALPNIFATLVVDCVVKPVVRKFDYVRHFHDNVEKLREKKHELADARDRLLHKIEDAKSQLLQIENDVQNLQSRTDETLSDMGTLEEEIQLNRRCLNWCPNWSWRYQLSKKAMKKIQDISELLDKFGQLGRVGYRAPTPLPTIDFLCSKEFVFSKSSETAFYQIIEALKDENINMIGLWGMGGVGKTTLAREVGSRAQKLNLFDKVVITVVSQKPNFERIQDQIAQYIGFDMKNEQGRRSEQELWLRLKNEPRILIILDDIWESINLKEKIGIPIGDDHKGCKVLLTTRRKRVCQIMECQPVVQLDCLDDDEAWTLFEKKAGLDDFSDDSIKTPAKKIVKKCGGLPIAIIPLASALKGKTNCYEWEATYRRLEGRRLTEIEDVNEENAYVCLEASFDYLKDMETKTCFLLCSLYPEDHEIYVEDLVGYAWGLELYKGVDSIKDLRSEVLASIETLKNSGLLLDCGERHVKMHDVVRQFALWIASSRKEISFGTVETLPMDESFKRYTTISFVANQTDELPKGVVFPNLKFLLHGGGCFKETSSEFFVGMKALQVCALKCQLISLAAFQFHMNLRTLCLIGCQLSDIPMLGKLKTLHILSLRQSYITELPIEAGELENLRLLDLSLSELDLLPKLVVISLDISSKDLPDGFVFRRLWSFDFCIGIEREMWYQERETYSILRSLRISNSVDACKQLFEDVESLELNDVEGHPNLIPSLDLGFRKLTSLDLDLCSSMQCLIDASKQQEPITAFSNLRKLSLSNMFDLEEMCNVPQPQGFLQKLEEVIVSDCDKMQVLFPIAELRSIEQEGPSRHLSLQSLKIVEIKRCNNLKYIFPMSVANSLGQLHTLKIKSCWSLEGIIQDSQVPYISLQSLREIEVGKCYNLKYLFPLSVANTLEQLHTLKIKSCRSLEGIIQDSQVPSISLQSLREIEVGKCYNLKYLFPLSAANTLEQLHTLKIKSCRRLEGIIQDSEVPYISLQSLSKIEVEKCDNLKYLFPLSVANTLGQLHTLKIKSCSQLQDIIQEPQVAYICLLQSLREVSLIDLPQLKGRDVNGIMLTQLSLQKLEVHNCPQLTHLIISTTIQELVFGKMTNEQLSNLHSSKHVELEQDQTSSQHHPLPICFPNLTLIDILECESLKSLFPIIAAQGSSKNLNAPNLQILKIERCFGMEEIFQPSQVSTISFQCLREVQVTECSKLKFLFPVCVANSLGKLQTLKIERCFEMEKITQDSQVSTISFQCLREVQVRECYKLKFLFPICVANSLGKLQTLKIERCFGMEEIIQNSQVSTISFQCLKEVQVTGCNNLKFLFSTCVATSLGKLQTLKIEWCFRMEEIVQHSQVSTISFQCLWEVQVTGCNNLKYLFPTCVAGSLGQLQTLKIESCSQLQDIIQGPEVSISMAEGLTRLNAVELINLPQLKGRDRNGIVLTSPSLHVLKVRDCPQLTPFIVPTNIQELEFSEMTEKKQISNVTVPEWRGGTSISNFEELFEYSGYNLSTLRVLGLYKLTELRVIWSGPIQVEHFQNLTQLVVHNCRRLRYIFSPTIARNLPQLWGLDISDCEELEQIIEKDQTPSQHHLQPICFPDLSSITIRNCENLKCLFPITLADGGLPTLGELFLTSLSKLEQVFEGDESNVSKDEEKVIYLPQLDSLWLDELPNLVSFSPMGYHFVFPSLEILTVRGCPNINTRFVVDSKRSVHAKTQASQSVDEIIVEESATAQETAWPIGNCPNIFTRFSFDSEKSVHAKIQCLNLEHHILQFELVKHGWNTGCGLCGEADAREDLLHNIEEAKNRLLLIQNDVQNLQSRADKALLDMGTLEEEIQLNKRCLNWCPNWSWRYQLSKKAMKKIQDMSELLAKFGQLVPVGNRDLLPFQP